MINIVVSSEIALPKFPQKIVKKKKKKKTITMFKKW